MSQYTRYPVPGGGGGGGGGTVTSVALGVPSIFSSLGSPITTSGTLVITLNQENANTVFSGPPNGAATTPTFRSLVLADLPAQTGTGNVVLSASPTLTGTISAGAANFSGAISASNFSGSSSNTNNGDVTLAPVDSAPNANGASIAGQVLTLQPADATNPGLVSTVAQTFAGDKTFSGNTVIASGASSAATIGNASSTAINKINGGINYSQKTITAATYTVDTTTTDYIIYTDSTSNAITITLPAPTAGRLIFIQDKAGTAATNNITIKQHAAETISGLTQQVFAVNYSTASFSSDGTNWVISKIATSGSSFLTSGTTYTTPVNITPQTRFKFTVVGGGGGGGGSNATNAKGTGGGAGGTAYVYSLTGLAANTGYTMAIGAAGAGGISSTTAATNGGNTSITINATTYTGNGGTGGLTTAQTNGGAGGTATNGTINISGQAGGATGNISNSNVSGMGGSSEMGRGGASAAGAGNGIIGTGYGAGGSGSVGVTANGGAGSQGAILVEWNN